MHRMCRCLKSFVAIATVSMLVLTKAEAAQQPAKDWQVQIVADDMCCKGCARKISGQLYTLKGVKSVGVDLSTHTVNVSLPNPSSAKLGSIWHAVEKGEGRPTSLRTSTAVFELVRPKNKEDILAARQLGGSQQVVIDNLHCKGCAQKIAAQLYAIKGVIKVSVDMQREILIVEADPRTPVSPWLMIDAVSAAKERAVAIRGNYGTLAITWSTEAEPKSNHQAQHSTTEGIQR